MDKITKDNMEEGMTYHVKQASHRYVFKYAGPSKDEKRNVMFSYVMGVDRKHVDASTAEITVGDYDVRRATVEEDVWMEECMKAGKWMEKDEAIAEFNKRFEPAEEKK